MNSDIAVKVSEVSQGIRSGFWMARKMILHDLSFDVKANTVTGLLGPNGAGKTTLIHLMTGLQRSTRGQVEIFGTPAWRVQARRKVGYLPERPYFYEHLTGEAFLTHMAILSGMEKKVIHSDLLFFVVAIILLGS